ncbi:MAG: malonyl-CoA/methylmalonyl-CoA synthetase [Burkholderiaceae bacterium]|jgi:malonyl-CoA/methylmalonyl-CoA synthetase
MSNLYALFAANFPADRNTCCIENHDGLEYSWHDIEHASARMANLLASLALPAGSRIAVQVEKSPEALILYLATLRAGFTFVPLNTAYRAAEMDYFLNDAKPALLVCAPSTFGWISKLAFAAGTRQVFTLDDQRHGSLLERAAVHSDTFETVDVSDDDLAALLYTSGTTGRSKGAMLSHRNLATNAQVLQQVWHWQADDVLLHALPLFHIHGLFVACHGALLNGSKMIFLPRFDSATVIRHLPRATVFMGVPTFYVRLLADPAFERSTCASIRLFISGSAPLLLDTFDSFITRTGMTILERYGMSETAMMTSNPYDGTRVGGTVGLPLPGITMRVVDDQRQVCTIGGIGAIEVRGPNVFRGYWQMPEKTALEFTADGYFITGDVGFFDAQGYLSIVGRSKDLIISGGYNIYPKEIESFLDELDGVEESAVIGVPHADFGEAVMAIIVTTKGATLTEAGVIAAMKASIANFKVPKRVVFVDELPRNAMSKVQKNVLRERYQLVPEAVTLS